MMSAAPATAWRRWVLGSADTATDEPLRDVRLSSKLPGCFETLMRSATGSRRNNCRFGPFRDIRASSCEKAVADHPPSLWTPTLAWRHYAPTSVWSEWSRRCSATATGRATATSSTAKRRDIAVCYGVTHGVPAREVAVYLNPVRPASRARFEARSRILPRSTGNSA
jgi:hypothetical protein